MRPVSVGHSYLPALHASPMKILALDLGTKLGWAMHCPCEGLHAGTVVLATPKSLQEAKKLRLDRRLDIRVQNFAGWLEARRFDQIVYEDIRFCVSQAQAHLWASLRGVVWSYAARRGTVIDCLDTGKLKKWTTGSGAADKQAMWDSARIRWPHLVDRTWDDNAVDAFCLLQFFRSKQLSLSE